MRTQIVNPIPGYDPPVGRWLWAFEESRERTLRVLKRLDPNLLDWIPPWGGNTISALLYHLAAIEVDWLFTDILEQNQFPPQIDALFPYEVRDKDGSLTAPSGIQLDAHLLRLSQMRKYFLDALRGMSESEFRRVRKFSEYQVTPEWTIHHLMQHEAEHRGEILVIMEAGERLNPGS
jgi:uncharacterized damage-inducible protein DinB